MLRRRRRRRAAHHLHLHRRRADGDPVPEVRRRPAAVLDRLQADAAASTRARRTSTPAANLMGAVRTVAHRRRGDEPRQRHRRRRRRRGVPPAKEVLIGLGLLISIPLVVFGAAILIKLIDRYPDHRHARRRADRLCRRRGDRDRSGLVAPWVDENAHWLHWGGPLLGADPGHRHRQAAGASARARQARGSAKKTSKSGSAR